MRWRLAIAVATACACSPAAPQFAGGRTVPQGRSDLAIGTAVRVPVGDLVPQEPALIYAAPGGVAPLGFLRHGVTRDFELGLDVIGSSVRGSVRGQLALGGGAQLSFAAMPAAGVIIEDESTAFRGGGLVPVVLSIDLTSLYEAWIGVRVGLEHVAGELSGSELAVSGLRTGGVVGLAVGFRRLHLLVELAVDHEYWWGHFGDNVVERNGVSLTPAVALRLRL